MPRCMVTTSDNPYNPFDDFDKWNRFDVDHGYNTNSYLYRIAKVSNEMSEADIEIEIESAVDEILEYNLTGNYVKVYDSAGS